MARKLWTPEEDESLVRQWVVEKKKLPQIKVPGWDKKSIGHRRILLYKSGRLTDAPPPRAIKDWSEEEFRKLAYLVKEFGFGARKIAKKQLLPGRSADSIGSQIRRRGLGNKTKKERSKNAHRLTKERSNALNSYLLGMGRLVSSAEAAAVFCVSEAVIIERRFRLKVPLTYRQARLATKEYRARQPKKRT